jgi:putative membrane protein insertion efficiency factor
VKRVQGLLRELLLVPLHLYRRLISPALAPRCKYYPSCSAYTVEAVRELGVLRGAALGAWRLARCNPWSHGGVDELADRRLFRGTALRSERAAAGADTATPHGPPAS